MVVAGVGEAEGLVEPVLAQGQRAPDVSVELGPDQVAEDVSPGPDREGQLERHHRRSAAVLGPAPESRAPTVERHLAPAHGHRHRAPALPGLVELLHLHAHDKD